MPKQIFTDSVLVFEDLGDIADNRDDKHNKILAERTERLAVINETRQQLQDRIDLGDDATPTKLRALQRDAENLWVRAKNIKNQVDAETDNKTLINIDIEALFDA